MRTLGAAVAIAAVAMLAVGALAVFNLRVFVDSHRTEVLTRAERALGRSLTVGAVTASWWPLGIHLRDVVLGDDARFGGAPFIEAPAVRITVRLVPLVLGRVEVSGIVLDEPRIALIRDAHGRWNVASIGRDDDDAPPTTGAAGARKRRPSFHAPLAWLGGFTATSIRSGRVDIEDRAGPVPRRLTAGAVRLRASELRFGGAARLELHAAIFPGSMRPDTHLTLEASNLGEYDFTQTPFSARLELADVDLGTLAMLVGRRERWAGRLTRLTAATTGTLDRLAADVEADGDGGWRFGPHVTVPRMPLGAHVRADVRRDGLRIADARGAVGTLEWTATGQATFDPWRGELALQSVPGSAMTLALGEPEGRLSDVALALVAADTLEVRAGHARIDDAVIELTARLASLDPLVADGRTHVSAFSGAIDVVFDVDSAAGARVRADATRLDAGAIAARSGESLDTPPTGKVSLAAAVSWPWEARHPLASLSGSGTLTLEDGTIGGVNVVGRVLQRVPSAPMLPQLLSADTRAAFPAVFAASDTAVRMARLPFTVDAGTVTVAPVVVRADHYDIVGDGTLDAHQQLRFAGDIVLTPELSTALRRDIPAMRYLARPDGAVVLPFRVRGPLTAPRPEPDTKRLSARGLDALLDAAGARAPLSGTRRSRPSEAPDEDPRVRRLERMMRP